MRWRFDFGFLPFGKWIRLAAIGGLGVGLFGCKPAAQLHTTPLKQRSAAHVMRQVARHQLQAHWLSGRARVDLRGEGARGRLQAIVRLRRDSALWLAFRKYNVEAARVLVRPDSIFILDRLGKQYVAEDIGFIRRRFGLPFGFREIQMLVLGNPVMLGTRYAARTDSLWYVLESEGQRFEGAWWFGADWRLRKMRLYDPLRDQEFIYRLADWRAARSGTLFSYLRTLEVFTPATGTWQLEWAFSKVSIDEPKSLKFEIPTHYTRVE